jgi:uncharacterized membrane protein YfcA
MFFANKLKIDFFAQISWTIIPIYIAIFFGYHVHLKIKDEIFKRGVATIILLASIKFLFSN